MKKYIRRALFFAELWLIFYFVHFLRIENIYTEWWGLPYIITSILILLGTAHWVINENSKP